MSVRLLAGLAIWLAAVSMGQQVWGQGAAAEARMAVGTIQTVKEDYSGFSLSIGEGEEQAVEDFEVGPATQYLLNGEKATASEALVAGAGATVTSGDDLATKVEVTTDQDEDP